MSVKKTPIIPQGWEALFLADCITARHGVTGGDRHFMEVASNWRETGCGILVITPKAGKKHLEAEGFTGPYQTLPFAWIDRLGLVISYLVRGLSALLYLPWRRQQVILYSTSDFLPDTLPGFLFRALARKPVIWVTIIHHIIPPPRNRPGPFLSNMISYVAERISLGLIRRRADVVLTVSPFLRDKLVAIRFSPERVFLTANATYVPESIIQPEPRYDACFVGRLSPSKGIFELSSIWQRVNRERPGSALAIVGAGDSATYERLKGQFREKGIDNLVNIPGYLDREELERVFASSKVFILPSHEEGFGISLLEAMVRGLPAVAYELPHYPEVFGDALATAPMGDEEEFASRVLELLEDEGLYMEKREASMKMADRYTWEGIAQTEAEAISTMIGQRFS